MKSILSIFVIAYMIFLMIKVGDFVDNLEQKVQQVNQLQLK